MNDSKLSDKIRFISEDSCSDPRWKSFLLDIIDKDFDDFMHAMKISKTADIWTKRLAVLKNVFDMISYIRIYLIWSESNQNLFINSDPRLVTYMYELWWIKKVELFQEWEKYRRARENLTEIQKRKIHNRILKIFMWDRLIIKPDPFEIQKQVRSMEWPYEYELTVVGYTIVYSYLRTLWLAKVIDFESKKKEIRNKLVPLKRHD